ncbi:MAG: hypothetical protein EZS28_012698 [Streblomastix strix]|uniref:Tyr recombinase domain-containing protein n=1 Tax=Streblomastix strix TaxID=222440 RepID=A0A5J4WA11_9EUKA|nr:MAG: hypothetical protein EZS28_012698 [Streblomastix strix]
MVKLYIPDKETQWNMEENFGCEQIEQGNREITFQNAWTRGSTIASKLNGLRNISRSQISISPHHSISKLNIIPCIQFQQQQLRIQSNAIWDQAQPNLLPGSNRINLQTNKTTFTGQNTELLRRYSPNLSGQINTQNINNGNNEDIGIVRMDNFNRQMRDRTEIDNNISGMDIEFEKNEYKNVGREKVKDDISIKRLVQHSIQEQKREDKITSSADRQIELPETSDKGSISISNRIRQSENASVKDGIMGLNNNTKQSSNQGIEMVDKENRGQPTRIINQQNDNMHVNNRCITIGLGSDTNIREPDRTDTTRLLERKGSRNNKQCQRNKSYLLRDTPLRASLQEDARSGSLDTFRQHNSSIRYWEIESDGIPDRKNKISILSGEKTQTTDHNNPHPRKTELNNRLTLETMQIGRLLTEGRNNLNDLQDMKLHATDRHIRNTIQQTNQQLCNSGSQRSGDMLPQRIQLQMEQSQIIYPSTNTSIRQSSIENEVGQSAGNSNSTDLAATIVVHQTKEFIHQIPFPWINRQDSGDGTENERQGSKTSTRQCGRLPSGLVADVGRDLQMRYMKMRGFSENGVNLLFNRQKFNTVKRDFYSLALLQNWLDIERITIEEMMKRDAEIILTEVIAFHTRQNNSVASAQSHKACLTTMLSLIFKENLASSTTSKLINKALANATIPHRRYQNIWNIQILFNHWRQSRHNKYLNNYDLQVRMSSLLMSVCFFGPNEIAEIRLKFSNVNKTENQTSLRLAPKQANAIETYEVYETDNEKLSSKLATYEWIDRLKKQFPKGTDFLLWHKGFNKSTTTKDISLQLTKLLRELKIVGASAYSIRHSASTELAKLDQTKLLGN